MPHTSQQTAGRWRSPERTYRPSTVRPRYSTAVVARGTLVDLVGLAPPVILVRVSDVPLSNAIARDEHL
jgi:hypothetical protein